MDAAVTAGVVVSLLSGGDVGDVATAVTAGVVVLLLSGGDVATAVTPGSIVLS